jgi:hypothetical protein
LVGLAIVVAALFRVLKNFILVLVFLPVFILILIVILPDHISNGLDGCGFVDRITLFFWSLHLFRSGARSAYRTDDFQALLRGYYAAEFLAASVAKAVGAPLQLPHGDVGLVRTDKADVVVKPVLPENGPVSVGGLFSGGFPGSLLDVAHLGGHVVDLSVQFVGHLSDIHFHQDRRRQRFDQQKMFFHVLHDQLPILVILFIL